MFTYFFNVLFCCVFEESGIIGHVSPSFEQHRLLISSDSGANPTERNEKDIVRM